MLQSNNKEWTNNTHNNMNLKTILNRRIQMQDSIPFIESSRRG